MSGTLGRVSKATAPDGAVVIAERLHFFPVGDGCRVADPGHQVMRSRFAAIALVASGLAGCGGETSSRSPIPAGPAPVANAGHPAPASTTVAAVPGPFRFVDICPGSGVDFVHVSGMTPQKLFPTANGSGVAIFDFDGDGKLDLYFATGNVLPLSDGTGRPEPTLQEPRGGKFRDETDRSGLGFRRLLPRHHRRRY